MTSKLVGGPPISSKPANQHELKPPLLEEQKQHLSRGSGNTSHPVSRQESGPLGHLGKFTAADTISEYLIKDKYRLLCFCKGGAFGDVFFAKHAEKGYDVAVKFVNLRRMKRYRVIKAMKRQIDNMRMKLML